MQIITFLSIASVAFAQSTESSAASANSVATATVSADASASASASVAGPVATGAPTLASIEAALQALPTCASACLITDEQQYPSLVAVAGASDPTAQAALLEKEVATICADVTFATAFTKCITETCIAADLEQSKTAASLVGQGCALFGSSSNVTASASATTKAAVITTAVATTSVVANTSKSDAFSTVLTAGCAAISFFFL
ncbi:UNVERIFIED_CONTAM: hypothetical protein HDU68_002492 [Siphonaria sp. JEL0065]|nr:hypothetical protein HDU68_002492 [Siphonaria sp. JEL0065]